MPPGPPPTTQQVVCAESIVCSAVWGFGAGITSVAMITLRAEFQSKAQIYTARSLAIQPCLFHMQFRIAPFFWSKLTPIRAALPMEIVFEHRYRPPAT